MNLDEGTEKAQSYLEFLCGVKPNRRTGSPGNQQATAFFADTIRRMGYEVDASPFDCLDHQCHDVSLRHGNQHFAVRASPYSLECEATAQMVAVSTAQELEEADCEGKILLLLGEICSEQLMPKHFVFYNPEHHQWIVALLESKKPAAIITATEKKPDQVGALYPFPLIVDGDFDIPSVYCRDTTGRRLTALAGETVQLRLDASRIPSHASNVIAKLNEPAASRVVITAHIDAYEESPGASDNASGTAVLLLCAEMLSDYQGDLGIEFAVLNGEDHYSAAGQMDYLRRYGVAFPGIRLAVNVDDVGFRKGRTHYSLYGCSEELQASVRSVLGGFTGLASGPQWFNGDHMLFVQRQVPSLAMTSESMPELMRTVTHTTRDTPDLIDSRKLVEIASSLNALVRSL